ncbi:MAG: substrate-binding domain-containing protein [Hyphomicrobiales bacterium]|nr:substrate-binding domain-containing protein [Hyphomicrobiales bacterium]
MPTLNMRNLLLGSVFAGTGLLMAGAAAAQDLAPVKVTFIQHCCSGITFFQPMQFGAEEAARLFQVDLTYVNADGDAARAANLIETAIAEGQDAILATITVPDALDEAVQKAVDAGVLVIAQNIDDPDGAAGNARQSFVGQDFIASGNIIGKRMISEHGLKEGDHCLLPVEFPELTYGIERAQGVQSALEPAGITSDVVGTGTAESEALTIISQSLIANPDIDCIVGLGTTPTTVAPDAANEIGRTGIPIGGFDTNPKIMDNIMNGVVTATMDQQPFWQGYLPVMFAAYHTRYGLTPPDIDTGNNLIDASNGQKALEHGGTYR